MSDIAFGGFASEDAFEDEVEIEEYPLFYIVRRSDFALRTNDGFWTIHSHGGLFTPEEAKVEIERLQDAADIVTDKAGAVRAHIQKLLDDRLADPPIPGTVGSIMAGLETVEEALATSTMKTMYFPSDTTMSFGMGVLHGATGKEKEIIFDEGKRRAYNAGYVYGEKGKA